jgi:hypothetical protein
MLLEDTADEYKSIVAVKSRFETWKAEFKEEYEKAYGGLSMPGVFEFYVRYEMLTWQPFKVRQFVIIRCGECCDRKPNIGMCSWTLIQQSGIMSLQTTKPKTTTCSC